jgi:hypothetical protein
VKPAAEPSNGSIARPIQTNDLDFMKLFIKEIIHD